MAPNWCQDHQCRRGGVGNFGEWKNQHKCPVYYVIRGGAKKLPVPWHWWTGQFGAIIYIVQYLIEFRICSSKAQAGTLLAKGQSQKLTIKLGILFCTLNKWLAKCIYLLLLLLLILTAKNVQFYFCSASHLQKHYL